MPRFAAIKVLLQVTQHHKNLTDALGAFRDHPKQSLIAELCFGVCRQYYALKAILEGLCNKAFKTKDKDIELALLLGLYQLKFMNIKPFAAVDETVKVALKLRKQWAKSVINATLRRFIREQETIETQLKTNIEYQTAHPAWLLRSLEQQNVNYQPWILNNNQQAPLYLRLDLSKVSRDRYLRELQNLGIEASLSHHLKTAICLHSKVNIPDLPGFEQGWFYVQDLAAQFCSELLDLQDEQRILDACCAPGGKLAGVLLSGYKFNKVIALDNQENRLTRVHQNLERLQLSAEVVLGDACEPQQWWDGESFDRIIVDAPCSALGVMRRHPDIKLLRDLAGVKQACQQQAKILKALWSLLKPGGYLLYATCSILPDENENQIKRFLDQQPDAHSLNFDLPLGEKRAYGHQLYPGETDGFYYALLTRSS